MAGLTLTAICRELGISQPTGSRYKARGMPLHSLNAAREWYDAHVNARVREDRRPTPPVAAEPIDAGSVPDYQESRARREAADAELAELKVQQMRGTLGEVAPMRAEFARQWAAVSQAMLNLPARMAPVLAAETDVGRVQTLLDAEIRQALNQNAEAGI